MGDKLQKSQWNEISGVGLGGTCRRYTVMQRAQWPEGCWDVASKWQLWMRIESCLSCVSEDRDEQSCLVMADSGCQIGKFITQTLHGEVTITSVAAVWQKMSICLEARDDKISMFGN